MPWVVCSTERCASGSKCHNTKGLGYSWFTGDLFTKRGALGKESHSEAVAWGIRTWCLCLCVGPRGDWCESMDCCLCCLRMHHAYCLMVSSTLPVLWNAVTHAVLRKRFLLMIENLSHLNDTDHQTKCNMTWRELGWTQNTFLTMISLSSTSVIVGVTFNLLCFLNWWMKRGGLLLVLHM